MDKIYEQQVIARLYGWSDKLSAVVHRAAPQDEVAFVRNEMRQLIKEMHQRQDDASKIQNKENSK